LTLSTFCNMLPRVASYVQWNYLNEFNVNINLMNFVHCALQVRLSFNWSFLSCPVISFNLIQNLKTKKKL
jgi:hypothetical protein